MSQPLLNTVNDEDSSGDGQYVRPNQQAFTGNEPFLRSRGAILFLVMIGLMADFTTFTIIIPIIPDYLKELDITGFLVGLLFAMRGITQILANFFWGYTVDRVGSTGPLFVGLSVLFASTVFYAFSKTYVLLLVARGIQGIGSAACMTAGMAYISDVFPEHERGAAMGKALGGVGIGVMTGPALGGLASVDNPLGRSLPFLILAAIILVDTIFLAFMHISRKRAAERGELGPDSPIHSRSRHVSDWMGSQQIEVATKENLVDDDMTAKLIVSNVAPSEPSEVTALLPVTKPTSAAVLIRDPQIFSVLGAVVISAGTIALVEPLIPTHLEDTWSVPTGLTGVIFLATSISYTITGPYVGKYGANYNRRNAIAIGCVILAVGLPCMALSPYLPLEVFILAVLGSGMAFVAASAMPLFAQYVDQRYPNSYGAVFSLVDIGMALGSIVGPLAGTSLADAIGLLHACMAYAALLVLWLPILYFMRGSTDFIPPAPASDEAKHGYKTLYDEDTQDS